MIGFIIVGLLIFLIALTIGMGIGKANVEQVKPTQPVNLLRDVRCEFVYPRIGPAIPTWVYSSCCVGECYPCYGKYPGPISCCQQPCHNHGRWDSKIDCLEDNLRSIRKEIIGTTLLPNREIEHLLDKMDHIHAEINELSWRV